MYNILIITTDRGRRCTSHHVHGGAGMYWDRDITISQDHVGQEQVCVGSGPGDSASEQVSCASHIHYETPAACHEGKLLCYFKISFIVLLNSTVVLY